VGLINIPNNQIMKKRIIPFGLLIVYCLLLIEILVLKKLPLIRIGHMMFNFGGTQNGPANFIPFKTLIYYLSGRNGLLIAAINIIGNIIALVPFGFLLPFVTRDNVAKPEKLNWKKTILLGTFAGVSIETTQAFLHIGIFDIDDIILNGLGVVIGFLIYNFYSKFSHNAKRITNASLILLSCSIIIFFELSYFKVVKLPIGIESENESRGLPPLQANEDGKVNSTNCCDLCNGTGGTGEIIATEVNSITIKSRASRVEKILLTNKTTIKNSRGITTSGDLKIGGHVTVIIDDSETASLVLICGFQ
jgi:glycopeptide antibiotics resistance protein